MLLEHYILFYLGLENGYKIISILYYHPFLTRPVRKIFDRLIFSLDFELIFY